MSKRVHILASELLPVAATAATASRDFAAGQFIPVVMCDLRERPDVREVVRAHKHVKDGDCVSQWGSDLQNQHGAIYLHLRFERPIAVKVVLAFPLPQEAAAVDAAIGAKALYLQHGLPGEALSDRMDEQRILVQLPPTGFEGDWDRIFTNAIAKNLRKEEGLTRPQSRRAAREFVERWRSLRRPLG